MKLLYLGLGTFMQFVGMAAVRSPTYQWLEAFSLTMMGGLCWVLGAALLYRGLRDAPHEAQPDAVPRGAFEGAPLGPVQQLPTAQQAMTPARRPTKV